jgi:aquaporin Z
MSRELGAEFIGTFTLVTAVCGAALFSAPSAGLVAVAFAVGLSVLAMAYAVGPISGWWQRAVSLQTRQSRISSLR